MKFLVLSFALVAAISAQQPYKAGPSGPAPYARILDQTQEVSPDGSYNWKYDTENGISAYEAGTPKVGPNGEVGTEAVGGYQYTAPDGQVVVLKYIADAQGGYRAEGSHLPVGPPIPEAILRSLAYNAAHPQKDDVYYKPEEKPYYTQPIAPVPRPYVAPQFPKPTPFYPSVQPTYQSAFQAGSAQVRGAFQPGRR